MLWAKWGVELLLSLAPEGIPRLDHIGIDGRVLGWTVVVSLVTGVLFGLTPAWQDIAGGQAWGSTQARVEAQSSSTRGMNRPVRPEVRLPRSATCFSE